MAMDGRVSGESSKTAVLVTGACGFVGHHLCRILARRGYAVRAAVREMPVRTEEGVDYVALGDINDQTDWASILTGIEVVVHAAGTTEDFTEPSGRWLVAHNKINVAGTASLAQAAMDGGVRRLIFLSTVGVRSAERGDDPTGFEQSKWEAEQVLRGLLGDGDLDLVVLRLPPLYGPEKAGILRMLGEAICQDRPLPLGSVQNQMSLLFVGNLVSAIERCLTDAAATGQTFAVSDGEAVSTPELIERLAEAMGREVDIWPCPPAVLNFAARLAGYGKAVRALTEDIVFDDQDIVQTLAWEPPIEVDAALGATVNAWRLDDAQQETLSSRNQGIRDRLVLAAFNLGQRIVRRNRNRRESRLTGEAQST